MTPAQLDMILYGVKVYLRRRPFNDEVYATTHDFSRFIKEEPLEVVRVKITRDMPADYDFERNPTVLGRMRAHGAQV